MNYIIDNCIVTESNNHVKIMKMKNDKESNYPKLYFGSKINDNYVLSLLSDNKITTQDLHNDDLINKYLSDLNMEIEQNNDDDDY